TSVLTRRLMRPSDSATGVNASATPNFLYSTDVWQLRPSESQVMPPNTGNSPPARKLALSPEIAVRLGSASVRSTPARSIARNVAWTDLKLPVRDVLLSGCPKALNGLSVLKFT